MMLQQRLSRFLCLAGLVPVLMLWGCGSGTTSKPTPTTNISISGAITFPASLAKATAKQTGALVTVTNVVVKVFSVDTGKEITAATVIVQQDSANPDQNQFLYSVSGIAPNVNYVVKATRGLQVGRRYLTSTLAASGANLTGQTIDPVSTSTLIILQTKVGVPPGVSLGEAPLPSGVSTAAVNALQPAFLETSIRNDIANGTLSANVTLVNTVTAAIASNIDPVLNPSASVTQAAGSAAAAYTPPATAAQQAAAYVAQAQTFLANQDVANASTSYEAALVADPTNKDANTGGALTKIVMLIADPSVKDIIQKWGGVAPAVNQILSNASPVGNPFRNVTTALRAVPTTGLAKSVAAGQSPVQTVVASYSALRSILPKFTPTGPAAKSAAKASAPATAPTVSDMQAVISGTIIPALNEALSRLKKVEASQFSFTVTKAMQGNPVSGIDIVLNDGEFYAIETAINSFLSLLDVAVSYDLDLYDYDGNGTRNDYNSVSQDPLKTVNQGTFFTLKATGAASMQAGLTALQDAVGALNKTYAIVKTRTAADTAAGRGAFDLTGLSAQNRSDFEQTLSYALLAVAGQTDIKYNNNTKTITVNVTKFFTSPLTRANLPALGYDVQPAAALSLKYNTPVAGEYNLGTAPFVSGPYPISSEIVPTTDVPDYTLNGILPTNSPSSNVAEFTGILPVLSGNLLSVQGGGNPLPIVGGANFRVSLNQSEFYLGYNQGTNTAVYKLDTTTGIISAYCNSVAGVPAGSTYAGIGYYSVPSAIYGRTSKTVGTNQVYEYRALTVSNQVATMGAVVKSIQFPVGDSFALEYVGAGVDMLQHNTLTVSTPYTYKLFSSADPTVALLTMTDSTQQYSYIRDGVIIVRDNNNSNLLQYKLSSDGKSVAPAGTFTNINFTGGSSNGGTSKVFIGGSGYYWLFDGYKMIKYAGTPKGAAL